MRSREFTFFKTLRLPLLSCLGVVAAVLIGGVSTVSVSADTGSAGADTASDPSVSSVDASTTTEEAEKIDSGAKTVGEDADDADQAVKYGRYNPLNQLESWVLLNKGTQPAGPGGYTNTKKEGTYICRRCNATLYTSDDKFKSHCGWPSFDDEIEGAVFQQRDRDGIRTEILCKNCGAHLGHVFLGERLTEKNTRHCVNSVSMKFIPKGKEIPPKIKPVSQRGKTESPDR